MREKEQLETLMLEDKPALTSNAKPIPKGSGHSTDRYSKRGTGVTWSSRRQRRNLNAPEQRTLCETHRVKDKLMAAETEWARRRYMKPLEPLVRRLASILGIDGELASFVNESRRDPHVVKDLGCSSYKFHYH